MATNNYLSVSWRYAMNFLVYFLAFVLACNFAI